MIAQANEANHLVRNSNRPGCRPERLEIATIPPSLLLMDRLVEVLIEKAKTGLHWPDLYGHASGLLSQLGLPTRRGLLAAKRLRNAKRYASEHDFGAAAFELRLIRSQLA